MNMNPPRPSAASASANGLSHAPPPALPICLVELILAIAPIANPYSAISWPDLLFVLPRNVVPLAFHSLLVAANSRDKSWPVNRLHFDRVITDSTLDEAVDSLVAGMYSRLGLRHERLRIRFVRALTKAAKVDALDVMQLDWLNDDMFASDLQQLLIASAASGCTDTFEWWLLHIEKWGLLNEWNCELVFDTAVEHGHVGMLKYFYEHNFATWSLHSWKFASVNGRLNVLDWAKQRGISYIPIVGLEHLMIDGASAGGHVDVLKWWHLNHGIKSAQYTVAAMDGASASGHINVLDWWSRSGLPLKFTPQAQLAALNAGHKEVARFWSECGEYRYLSGLDLDTAIDKINEVVPIRLQQCDSATRAGFGRLIWIQGALPMDIPRRQLRDVCVAAARFGHVNVLDHYREKLKKLPHPTWAAWAVNPIVAAAEMGQVSAMSWLMTHVDAILFVDDDERQQEFVEAASGAIENGHVCVLSWLLTNSVTRPFFAGGELVIAACENGSLPILTLFAAEDYLQMASEGIVGAALEAAADQGHVKVFEWWQRNGIKWPKWCASFCPLHAALTHSQTRVLDWFLENPQCGMVWQFVTEYLVAQLVSDRHRVGLEWLQRHSEAIRLCKWSKRRIAEYFQQ